MPLPDRISNLADRALKWGKLRKLKNAEKKLAVTVFQFPPDKGNVGTAAYLDVFGSIRAVLLKLEREVTNYYLLGFSLAVFILFLIFFSRLGENL